MAVTTFSAAGSNAAFSPGSPEAWTVVTALSTSVYRPAIGSAQIDGKFTGTQLRIQLGSQVSLGAIVYLEIDGVSVTPPTLSALNSFQWLTLATGLTDGVHTFSVKLISTTILVWVVSAAAFEVTGAVPAMSAPSNFGTQYRLVDQPAGVLFEGINWTRRTGSGDYINQRADSLVGSDAAITWKGTHGTVWVWATMNGGRWDLIVDRDTPNPTVYSKSAPVVGSTVTGWIQVATGLDSGAEHTYTLVCTNPSTGLSHRYLMTAGGSGINAAGGPSILSCIAQYGDSIWAGWSGTGDSGQGIAARLARKYGVANANLAIGGVTVINFAGSSNIRHAAASLEARIAEVAALTPAPLVVSLQGGTNDIGITDGSPSITGSPATVAAAWDRLITVFLLAQPTWASKTFVVGILPRNGHTQAEIDSYNDAIEAAIGGRVAFYNPRAWAMGGVAYLTGGAFDTTYMTDGLHPNVDGYDRIWGFLEPLVEALLDDAPPDPGEDPLPDPWLLFLDGEGSMPPPLSQGFGDRVVFVAPQGAKYTRLSDALGAIQTASPTDQWLIVVSGAIAEPSGFSAKSNISVLFLPGASVTITSNVNAAGITFGTLVNTSWVGRGAGPHIIRAGVVSANNLDAIRMISCDATVRLEGLVVRNNLTHAGSPSGLNGITVTTSSACSLVRCDFQAAAQTSGAVGGNFTDFNGEVSDCIFRGGLATGNGNFGLAVGNTGSAKFFRCRCIGGGTSTSTTSHGLSLSATGINEFTDCAFEGGSGTGGTTHGVRVNAARVLARFQNCRMVGGSGASTGNHGISCEGGSETVILGGSCEGGAGGTTCYGFTCQTSAVCRLEGVTLLGGGCSVSQHVSGSYSYAAATPSFVMDASRPQRCFMLRVVVSVATGGASVRIADDASNTNPLGASQSLAATGTFYIPVTSAQVIAAGGSLFVNVTGGAPADGSFTVAWEAEPSFGGTNGVSCAAAFPDSDNPVEFRNCILRSNSASDAVWISTNGKSTRTTFLNCTIRSGPLSVGTRKKAVNVTSSFSSAPVFECVLDGGSTNLTAAAATATNGTNTEV